MIRTGIRVVKQGKGTSNNRNNARRFHRHPSIAVEITNVNETLITQLQCYSTNFRIYLEIEEKNIRADSESVILAVISSSLDSNLVNIAQTVACRAGLSIWAKWTLPMALEKLIQTRQKYIFQI